MTRPYLPCTSPDCDRSTRAASRLCAIHRPSAVPTVTRSHNTISIGDRAFTPAEALELAERIADALAGENR